MKWINILFLFFLGHGTSFNIDCNICSCFAGNLVCSTRLCLSEHSSEDDRRTFTGNHGHPEPVLSGHHPFVPISLQVSFSGLAVTANVHGKINT